MMGYGSFKSPNAVLLISTWVSTVTALVAQETSAYLQLANHRLTVQVNKESGNIDSLTLDDQDLLGAGGVGPYLDCYCIPSGFYTPGTEKQDTNYTLFKGTDSSDVDYGGILMRNVYPPTGQVFEQYWFLRHTETGLHTFSRLAYHNSTTPFLRNLQEFRTLFRPKTSLWTHLITDETVYAPLPDPNPATGGSTDAITVQDATWYLGDRIDDEYVKQASDYFTKYTFATTYRDHEAHGLFAESEDDSTFGAWMVMETKDTYFGGPLHGDIVVDGILYNYMVSNHWGAGTPNITDGFDRTFGPQYYHFNRGEPGTTWQELRDDALQAASADRNLDFYDSISHHVTNYIPTSGRGSWEANVELPPGAKNAIAVLAQNGVGFQDNVQDVTAYQYWTEIPENNTVQINHIKAGTYRLTIYADGIFGEYTRDDITIPAGTKPTITEKITWTPESSGVEIWRIGNPDKSSGEYLHGNTPDPSHPSHLPQHRIYFGAYDFVTDFPSGVNFHIGTSIEARDFNYVHWSVFGGSANINRPIPVAEEGINNWTITFDLDDNTLKDKEVATLTIQLAGAKTASGNTDVYDSSQTWNDLSHVVAVNERDLEPWVIPYYHSSSCAVRGAITCYQVAHKFTFPTHYLTTETTNKIVLSLPSNATDYESALLPTSVYVQYDALRLEVK
ncbi:polysaccharide lyase family 4 protein [Poronia punctata]|nr:polysaccharide lyase family 4 protein [Poronia punctata]